MLKTLLCIAAGSGLGGVARYLVGRWVQSLSGAALFPWGTFAVNVAGCFIIGLIYITVSLKITSVVSTTGRHCS